MADKGAKLEPGARVVLKELPAGLLDGLPAIDQNAIKSIAGKQVTFVEYDGDGRARVLRRACLGCKWHAARALRTS
jgi:hypothetical protein